MPYNLMQPLEHCDTFRHLTGRSTRVMGVIKAVDAELHDDLGRSTLVIVGDCLPIHLVHADQHTGERDRVGIFVGLQLPVIFIH